MGSCNSKMQGGIVTESNAGYMNIQKYPSENGQNVDCSKQKISKNVYQLSPRPGIISEKQKQLVRKSWFELQSHMNKNIGAVMFIQ